MFERLNKHAKTIREGIKLDTMAFKPLKEFRGHTVHVDGFFFTDGKYGRQVVVVGNGFKINMPRRAVEEFETLMNIPEDMQGMLEGHLMLTEIAELKTTNGTTTSYKFTEC